MRANPWWNLVFVVVAACSGGKSTGGGGGGGGGSGGSGGSGGAAKYSRDVYHCTPAEGTDPEADIAACAAKPEGCSYQPHLICRGMQAPPDILEAERKAAEDGTVTCACVCPDDREMCSKVP